MNPDDISRWLEGRALSIPADALSGKELKNPYIFDDIGPRGKTSYEQWEAIMQVYLHIYKESYKVIHKESALMECYNSMKKEESFKEGNKVNHSLNRDLNSLVKANSTGATTVSTTPRLSTLRAFAGGGFDDEFKHVGQLPTSVKEALQKKLDKQKEEAAGEAADQIIGILKSFDTSVEVHVEAVRSLRKREKAELERLAKLNRAKDYALETNNYLPVAALLGQLSRYDLEEAGDLAKVPEAWEPAPAATATAAQ